MRKLARRSKKMLLYLSLRKRKKKNVVGVCTEPVEYERVDTHTHTHTFKTANFGDASEKRMHRSAAVQLCPLSSDICLNSIDLL